MTAPVHDVQGNILRGYTLGHAAHLFVAVAPGAGAAARCLLRDVTPRITTAAPWPRGHRPSATLNVALTYPGLAAVARAPEWLEAFPPEFEAGMEARAESVLGDRGPSAPSEWEEGLRDGEAHILLTLYAPRPGERDRAAAALADEIAGRNGLTVVLNQATDARADAGEHFGFRDGFSQPAVEGSGRSPRGEGVRDRLGWRPVRLGEFVLGHLDEDGIVYGDRPEVLRNGTFMVWRKLAQDTRRWAEWLLETAGGDQEAAERLGAQIVGRRRDGSSLMRPPLGATGPTDPDNDFVYRDDPHGLRCPLGAHVRRANPRDALGWSTERTKRHRIIRRGMAYGAGTGDGDRGLVFVCLNASIARQFEFVQHVWLGDGAAFGLGDDRDFLLGEDDADAKMTIQGSPPRFITPGRRFVTTRGGHYLFVPGLGALRLLAAG
ncbi:MAG: Dyp-type peroxidase [Solirubrobacteraceae bacterium]